MKGVFVSSVDISIFKSDKKGKCVIASLPFTPDQKEAFDAVMLEYDYELYPNVKILEVLHGWGFTKAKKTTLGEHRRRKCTCYRTEGVNQ